METSSFWNCGRSYRNCNASHVSRKSTQFWTDDNDYQLKPWQRMMYRCRDVYTFPLCLLNIPLLHTLTSIGFPLLFKTMGLALHTHTPLHT